MRVATDGTTNTNYTIRCGCGATLDLRAETEEDALANFTARHQCSNIAAMSIRRTA